MSVRVIGIDHVYLSVSDLTRSCAFYDQLMEILGFRRSDGEIGGDPHVHYYNEQFGFSLRPARSSNSHDPYSPGLHHFCFRVEGEKEVDAVAQALQAAGVDTSEPRLYPEYDADYYAIFLEDPDGIRLEVTNFRGSRRKRMRDGMNGS